MGSSPSGSACLQSSVQPVSNWAFIAPRSLSWWFADTRRPLRLTIIDIAKFLIDLVLRPRWNAIHQHVSQTPYTIRQPSYHSWRPGLPALDGSRLGEPIDLGQ